MSDQTSQSIGVIKGRTTPFGFKLRLNSSLHRNSYLAVNHEEQIYILGIQKLWNESSGNYAKVFVIGDTPKSPFDLDNKILLASKIEIKNALGLDNPKEKAIYLGEILYTDVKATPNIEKLGRVFITGKSGSGKSYTVGVIIEEMMKKHIPIIIIDRHGEYSSLKILNKETIPNEEEFFDKNDLNNQYATNIIEFGDTKINAGSDLDLEYLLAAKIENLVQSGNVIIINLRGLDLSVQENIVNIFCYRLYKASTLKKIPPHYLFIDEAHLFAGKKNSPIVETLKLSAQEGRKFGHNLVVITQKPQLLDVTIRSQAGTWIIHKLTDIRDVKITLNSAEGLSKDADEEIQNLNQGEAIITGDISLTSPLRINIRKRYTVHGGAGYNPLDFIEEGKTLPKANLVEKLRLNLTQKMLEKSAERVSDSGDLSVSELYLRIDNLNKVILGLKQELADNLNKPDDHETSDEIMEDIESEEILKIPAPEEMYDEKMLELMEEKDDLKIKLKDSNEKQKKIKEKLQTLQLTMSGIEVENENLKDNLKKEIKRGDDAVSLAEVCVAKLKKKKR